jgi:hypothetical protein
MPPHPPAPSDVTELSEADRERLFEAFIGPNWQRHYRGSFAALRASRSWWRGHWNWAAALVPFWPAWRRLDGYQALAFVVWCGLAWVLARLLVASDRDAAHVAMLAFLAVAVGEGCWGDRWLLARAQQVVGSMVLLGAVDQAAQTRVARRGGISVVRPALVLALLGLFLRWMRAPFWNTKEKAYVAAMKSDLRNLVTEEARHFAERGVYTANLADSIRSGTASSTRVPLLQSSVGVSVTVALVGPAGWYATARHNRTTTTCAIWVGSAPPHLTGTPEGEPKCRKP